MTILALQFDIAWEDKPANFAKVRTLIERAAPESDTLVVLPEMFATGFSMNAEIIAEAEGGETELFLAAVAREFGVFVLGGAAMRGRDGHTRNKALVFSPAGGLIAFYAKRRPFTPGGEREHYVAGEKPVVFRWCECQVSPFICYDLRFPELFRDVAATHRPEVFAVIASFPRKRISHWTALLRARAIENQAYVVGVNRIGRDPFYEYNGQSQIIDPTGEIVADGGEREGAIRTTPDLATLRQYREGLPFLDDLRRS